MQKGYNNVVSSNGNSLAQAFKFGGKELSQELDLNTYDFGARNYDHWLGRWSNIDPLAENYFSLSSYNYAANNPIFFIDPDGMEIKDPDNVVGKYKDHLNATKDKAKDLLQSGAVGAEFIDLLTDFSESELNKIDDLEKSDQVYSFSKDNSAAGGGLEYNSSNEEINVSVNDSKMGLIGHELNHAHQFDQGEISLKSDNSGFGSLYDVSDETESYNVERANAGGLNYFLNSSNQWGNQQVLNFGKNVMKPPAYQNLPTISINIKSKQGKNLRKQTIQAGKNGTGVIEVYIGWQKDYSKGVKKRG